MQSPRSRNLDRKPRAYRWVNENPTNSALLLEMIRVLEIGYAGDFSGYVDFAPAEYRFNKKKTGGYLILTARSNGSVQVRILIDKWKKYEVIDLNDIKNTLQIITKHKLINFDFENEIEELDFEKAVKNALNESPIDRKKKLDESNPEPKKKWQKVAVFIRNPYVVAEVLDRARGKCEAEDCGKEAPFTRRTNGTPYLEVHHRKRLSDGGEDTVSNAIALCPNCHRKQHFG